MNTKKWTSNFLIILGVVSSAHLMGLFLSIKMHSEKTIALQSHPDQHFRIKIQNHKKQIVRSEDSKQEREVMDNSFLSDKNRTFDRQTVSKMTDSFKAASKGNAKVNQKDKGAQEKKDFSNIKLSDVGISGPAQESVSKESQKSSESILGMENGLSEEQGLSATNDYIHEMKLGDFTQLNTTEFKHYGFYHRIRQKLEQFWGRSIQEKAELLHRSGRSIASQNHITGMIVILNERGEIISAEVKSSSGVKELDDAAIESFNEAGPFPNPPKDLLNNGRAVVEWGFVVKT